MFSDAPAAQIEITKTSPYSISRIAGKEFRSPIVHADQNPISAHQFNVELQRCSVFCGLYTSCYKSQSVVLVSVLYHAIAFSAIIFHDYLHYIYLIKVAGTSFLARGTGHSLVTRERNVRKKREIKR